MTKRVSELAYAGFGIRLVARIIDFLVYAVLLALIAIPVTELLLFMTAENPSVFGIWLILGMWLTAFFVIHGYFVILHALYGQTVGKKIVKIKVIKTDGSKIGWGIAILREIGEFIATIPFCLGYIWIIIDKKKQGWHDNIAKTYVVRAEKE